MSTDALEASRDGLMPRPADGMGRGAALALLVHGALIVAIAFGVNWRSRTPEGLSAELWSAVPQTAAPRAEAPPPALTPPTPPTPPAPPPPARPAPPPPPPPPVARETPPVADAQIAIEKARREEAQRQAQQEEARQRELRKQEALKLEAQKQEVARKEAARQEAARQKVERDRAEREKVEREKAERVKAAAEAQRREQLAKAAEAQRQKEAAEQERRQEVALAAQREAYLKRMQGQAGATGGPASTGTAARSSGPSAGYAGRIRARIKPNVVFTDSVAGNPVATVEVRLAPDGTILSRRLLKSSGLPAWDEAVLRAVDKTEVLPRDTDGTVPPELQVDFRPRD